MADNFSNFNPSEYAKKEIEKSQGTLLAERLIKGKSPSIKVKGRQKKSSSKAVKHPKSHEAEQEREEKQELKILKERKLYGKKAIKKIFGSKKGEKKAVKRREKATKGVLGAMGIISKTRKIRLKTRAQFTKLIKDRNRRLKLKQLRGAINQPIKNQDDLYNEYLDLRKKEQNIDEMSEAWNSESYTRLRDNLIRIQNLGRKKWLAKKRINRERKALSMSMNLCHAHLNKLSPQENSINSLTMKDNILNSKMNIMKQNENSIHLLKSNCPNILQTSENNNNLNF